MMRCVQYFNDWAVNLTYRDYLYVPKFHTRSSGIESAGP